MFNCILAGTRIQEPVQTTAAVLKLAVPLVFPEHLGVHRFEHPRVHERLTETHGFETWHLIIAAELVLDDMSQHYIHSLGAQEAVGVGLQVVASPLDLHLRLKVVNDAAPDKGGAERLPGHLAWKGKKER